MSFLERSAVQAKTEKVYLHEFKALMRFCESYQLRTVTDDEVDVAVTSYLNRLYQEGHQTWKAERTIAALLHFDPGFSRLGRRCLPRTFRALRGYRRRVPARSRTPHPLKTWMAIAVDLSCRGHLGMAVFALLMVQAYLRPGECLRLTPQSFVRPGGGQRHWCLLLHPLADGIPSKTGHFDETVPLDAEWALWMEPFWGVLSASTGHGESHSAWTFSYPEFLKEFNQSTRRVGVHMVPYQARHSGPSHDRMTRSRTQLEMQKKGRWQSFKSVMRYEKSGLISAAYANYSALTKIWIDARALDGAAIILGHQRSLADPPHR